MRSLLVALLFAGCVHTKSTQSQTSEQPQKQGKQVAAPRPVGTTPSSILRPGGMARIQKALGVSESGELDDRTRHALERFQTRHHLASTGEPDFETVEKLGLDTDDIFKSGSRKKETDTAARRQSKQ